jgi:hypothetical protein
LEDLPTPQRTNRWSHARLGHRGCRSSVASAGETKRKSAGQLNLGQLKS